MRGSNCWNRWASFGPTVAALFPLVLVGCGSDNDPASPTIPEPTPAAAPPPGAEPTKDDPVAFTQAFVQRAVDLFDAEGLDATLAVYNDPASVDGAWYVFIVDSDHVIIAHPTVPENIGDSLLGPAGVDSAGNIMGPTLAAASADGVWVDYNYLNPETGEEGVKHTWAIRHEGLLFASGWYEGGPTDASVEAQTQGVVRQAVQRVRESGLETAINFYNTPASTSGPWYVAFLDERAVVLTHADSALLGKSSLGALGVDVIGRVFGPEFLRLPPEGGWVDYASLNPAVGEQGRKHSWAQLEEEHWIVSGWYEPGLVAADPAARAVGVVEGAIQYADTYGEEAAVAFYNTEASTLGSWYAFLIDAQGDLVAIAPAPDKIGLNAYVPEDATDSAGHFYGPKLAQATEEGVWVTYRQANPGADGEDQVKHTFARRHGNLIFCAGWYEG
ncbi:MAG: hypothetical protein OXH05_07990 [Acidobacteria bacterium]|nr:hypothetical protein [Acidobacteriota bacterium]